MDQPVNTSTVGKKLPYNKKIGLWVNYIKVTKCI
jgi:hypothetical protein